jgi:arylsulfatase A-like enzyme
MHGAHGLFRKGWPYEESVRVPLLVRLPTAKGRCPGVRTAQLATLIDLPRWTAAWAGADPPGSDEPGAPAQEMQRISMPSVVRQPLQCDRIWSGIRTRRRKLILTEDGAPWLFFDRESDPQEEHNLAALPERAEEIARLRALYFARA